MGRDLPAPARQYTPRSRLAAGGKESSMDNYRNFKLVAYFVAHATAHVTREGKCDSTLQELDSML